MKTDMKLSGKMILFIIISCVIVVASVAVGLVFHFTGDGYFNYGADWTSDKSVTLTWYYTDGFKDNDTDLSDYCETAFENQGISYYAVTYGEADDGSGGDITYKFSYSTDTDAISAACDSIKSSIDSQFEVDETGYQDVYLTRVTYHVTETYTGSLQALLYAGIAVATIVVFEFLYVMIRYKISMAFGALLASCHNLALFIALVTLCRIPVGTTMYAFAALTVLTTMICTLITFGKLRKNNKDETLSTTLTPYEMVDRSASQTFLTNLGITASLAAAVVVMFVLLSISSLSPLAIISPVACALVAFVSAFYGTCFFMPSVYSRFKKIGLKFQRKKKTDDKSNNKDNKSGKDKGATPAQPAQPDQA